MHPFKIIERNHKCDAADADGVMIPMCRPYPSSKLAWIKKLAEERNESETVDPSIPSILISTTEPLRSSTV